MYSAERNGFWCVSVSYWYWLILHHWGSSKPSSLVLFETTQSCTLTIHCVFHDFKEDFSLALIRYRVKQEGIQTSKPSRIKSSDVSLALIAEGRYIRFTESLHLFNDWGPGPLTVTKAAAGCRHMHRPIEKFSPVKQKRKFCLMHLSLLKRRNRRPTFADSK